MNLRIINHVLGLFIVDSEIARRIVDHDSSGFVIFIKFSITI